MYYRVSMDNEVLPMGQDDADDRRTAYDAHQQAENAVDELKDARDMASGSDAVSHITNEQADVAVTEAEALARQLEDASGAETDREE